MKTTNSVRALLVLLFIATTAAAGDWPQYRGANHDGSSSEKITQSWPAGGPPVIWKAPLGPSFGSFAVSGDKAFCLIQRKVDDQDKEVVIALDAKTGKELWAVPLGKATYDKQGGDGPRSTPTVDGKRVYILGAYQILTCLDADTGKEIWQHDLVAEFGGRIIKWNNAASPILEGNLIFVNAGGAGQALLAFNKNDGKLVWKGEDDAPTHSSPVPATILGTRQIIFIPKKVWCPLCQKLERNCGVSRIRFKLRQLRRPLYRATLSIARRPTALARGRARLRSPAIRSPPRNCGERRVS